MQAQHYHLWERCREFVRVACAGRDSSHGLAHMEKVTESAILILCMQNQVAATDMHTTLSRVILVAMLHDVADHKYDSDGTLRHRVEAFIKEERNATIETAESHAYALQTIEAVSFSAEKQRGKRWFTSVLPTEWLRVRDIVSDADKLEAIGYAGLLRCLEYTSHLLLPRGKTTEGEQHMKEGGEGRPHWSREFERQCLQNVREHFEEKLNLLPTEYIVTEPGRFLALPRRAEMVEALHQWEENGLPPLS
ncbi:uncharacterized protein TEOVI_000134800 [Trypanosoma equiperdum]|nr:hypothetical protein, conserved [Trypanosoma equiperdum]